MSRNRALAEAFADQFEPRPNVVPVLRINNVPHRDAWMVAVFDERTQRGITAHAYGGQLHAFVEVLGDDAPAIGKAMAATLGRLRQDERKPLAEGPQDTGLGPQEGHAQQEQTGPAR